MENNQNELKRSLGFIDSTGLVVGTVIGTGIFLKTTVMSQLLPHPSLVLLVWILAGLLSLTGALTYAELGAQFPKAGGEFIYLEKSYGPLIAFLYGWSRFLIGSPASIAAYAVGSATFLSGAIDLSNFPAGKIGFAISLIVFMTLINCLQVKLTGKLQTALTFFKLLIIASLSATLIFATKHSANPLNLNFAEQFNLNSFGAAMLAALWAFDGWNNLPMVAGEIKNPSKIIPLALIVGMFLVLVFYLGANFSYFESISLETIQSGYSQAHKDSLPVATLAAQSVIGDSAKKWLSIAFVISAIGAMNGSILSNARVPYAMAKEGLFFAFLGRVNGITHIPVISVLVQGVISLLLAISGSFDQLTDAVVFSSWIFYALCAGSVILLRKRNPEKKLDFKVPLYPFTPLIFILISILLLMNTFFTNLAASLGGLVVILLGIPLYLKFRRTKI